MRRTKRNQALVWQAGVHLDVACRQRDHLREDLIDVEILRVEPLICAAVKNLVPSDEACVRAVSTRGKAQDRGREV